MPTVLDVTETPGPKGLDGISLRAIATSPEEYRDRVLIVDAFILDKSAGDTGTKFRLDLVSAVSDPHKLIMNRPGTERSAPALFAAGVVVPANRFSCAFHFEEKGPPTTR